MSDPAPSAPAAEVRTRRIRRVANRDMLPGVVAGALRHSLARPRDLRHELLKNAWIELKRFGAPNVINIEPSRIRGLERILVEGPISRHCTLVLAALGILLECETIFEFGTYRGDTTWLLAHNLPRARVYTLDLTGLEEIDSVELEPTDIGEYFTSWDRGVRFRGTPEAGRISELLGDSAVFDFAPYRGSMDLVYIDASHSYSYVRSDTEAALAMLSPSGTIVWDDYTYYAGIYTYLNELARSLDGPILHILGTRLAVYSRRDLVPHLTSWSYRIAP